MEITSDISSLNDSPLPIYRIDLSLSPSERYVHLAREMGPRMRACRPLFNELLALFIPWAWLRSGIEGLSALLLRKVFSSEQTQEIRGISRASGVPLYFLVALNVLLDSLLGCTSGGVMTRVEDSNDKEWEGVDQERMLHFRTMDWGMDELRGCLVVQEFIRSKSSEPARVIAKTITYAGMVGVLTGIREDLSVSLNFRPNHTCSTIALRIHQIGVLLGFRQSTPSIVRDLVIPGQDSTSQTQESLNKTVERLTATRTSPCYLILCDGSTTAILEKDLNTAETRTSKEFVVQTNHDTDVVGVARPGQNPHRTAGFFHIDGWIEESEERMNCLVKRWNSLRRRHEKKQWADGVRAGDLKSPVVKEELLKKWMAVYPVRNECTHFACIMDPKMCDIRWIERGIFQSENEGKE